MTSSQPFAYIPRTCAAEMALAVASEQALATASAAALALAAASAEAVAIAEAVALEVEFTCKGLHVTWEQNYCIKKKMAVS